MARYRVDADLTADQLLRQRIERALQAAPCLGLKDAAEGLLEVLGYRSERRPPERSGRVDDFIEVFPAINPDTRTENEFRENATSVEVLFQFTSDEIPVALSQHALFEVGGFDTGNMQSFMFAAVELSGSGYARGAYARFTREVNKRLRAPTIVLFRTAGGRLTFAFVHRRPHKLDRERDVLGSVSLIREIDPADPHRAHVGILADLALQNRLQWMTAYGKPRDFEGLMAAWLSALDTQELNKEFYGELFSWFNRAVEAATFPENQHVTLSAEEHVIRLITRLLFVWFVKEKGLIANDLFNEERIGPLLKDYNRANGDSYYRAVLQNLFFATLNTEIQRREFSKRTNTTHRDSSFYRYKREMSDPDALVELFDKTPFINGGLFDCLDSEEATGDGGWRIDCFSDNPRHRDLLSIPNRLFFDEDGLIPLLNRYKFTVEENTPAEQDVALDPELLGRVFENLLAAYNPETRETARKQTGSYYTPRPVVDYMVDEALIESLAAATTPADGDPIFWRERLRYLLDYHDASELFEAEETDRLIRAIAQLKVLDPAVGSGAFPISLLHKLTLALRRLDPDNSRWEELQKDLALERADHAFEAPSQPERDAELQEISDTFERYRDSDFGRKLYLIQNSIFGVDIQPIACQIAKLRFFISLAIEQDPHRDSSSNYGIKPLPNLETRFVAADTLLALQSTKATLTSVSVANLRQQLLENRERHFNAADRRAKLRCRYTDRRLRNDLATELRKIGMPAIEADRISQWDPYDQNSKANWFDPNYMFNISRGFDIVIANPPYVESRNNLLTDELKDAYLGQVRNSWSESLPRGSDLLIYFFARSAEFLGSSGLGCFITQNAWLSTDYGKKFQRFSLGKFSFQKVIDTSSKFFTTDSQNINAVIATFTRDHSKLINYGILDDTMKLVSERSVLADQKLKWGHAFSMPEFYHEILEDISQREKANLSLRFGQGVNFPRRLLWEPSASVPIVDKVVAYVTDNPDGMIPARLVSRSRQKNIPALIMPRGIGSRHYCMFNTCRVFSHSYVELYIPDHLWETDIHYCLWAYCNSSFVWLFREITGRKNLGGGLLKSEATDMNSLPIRYDFDFAGEARAAFEILKARDPLPVSEAVHTREHILLDAIVAEFFGFQDMTDRIRETLIEQVRFRQRRAR